METRERMNIRAFAFQSPLCVSKKGNRMMLLTAPAVTPPYDRASALSAGTPTKFKFIQAQDTFSLQSVHFGISDLKSQAPPHKTGIVATLGPKTNSPEMIKKLIEAGADVFRLNFSHGTHEDHGKLIAAIRQAIQDATTDGSLVNPIKILADIQGPKIRVGKFNPESKETAAGTIELVPDTRVSLSREGTSGDPTVIPVTLPEMIDALAPGNRILMDDGKLELTVTASAKDNSGKVLCKVVRGGTLRSSKGMNLPDLHLNIPALSDKDKVDIAFAIQNGVDAIAVSFVRSAEDMQAARECVKANGELKNSENIKLIAKLEKPEAVTPENLPKIVAASDGVMVARGDLGIEVDIVQIPRLQEAIIKEAKDQEKPVIVATQMLESMMSSTIPNRSDVSDIADAVKDGTDYVMLSGETAMGNYPAEAVKMMDRIIDTYLTGEDNAQPSLSSKIQGCLGRIRDILKATFFPDEKRGI